uniref:RRM domain-containing protein n=1 Tax=Ditylenchus dipsaci TaxID=166011 RepID=A0A915D4B4_9BILA
MVYNLCCSYGRFSSRADGYSTCFVEMLRSSIANCVCRNLDGCELNGKRLSVEKSFHKVAIYSLGLPFEMPDGTPLFKDFADTIRENLTWAPKKGQPPMISKLFESFSIQPRNVVIWLMVRDTCAGSVVFQSQDDALKALMLVNNCKIRDPILIEDTSSDYVLAN